MGRPARIDRAVVVATGLAIADEQDLEAVTMSAIAARLGVTPMALYRHVADKAELMDGIIELLLTEFPTPTGSAWSNRLEALANGIRASAQRHPSVFPLLLQRPVRTPRAVSSRCGLFSAEGSGHQRVRHCSDRANREYRNHWIRCKRGGWAL